MNLLRPLGLESLDSGKEFRVSGFEFQVRVEGWEFWVSAVAFQLSGFGFRVWCFGFRVSGFESGGWILGIEVGGFETSQEWVHSCDLSHFLSPTFPFLSADDSNP